MRYAATLTFALALTPSAALAQSTALEPLTSPETLADMGDAGVLVLDIRGDAYSDGHIPGAVSAPYGLFRGPAENPGELISEERLTEVLREAGVETDRPTIIVHQGDSETDFGAAARVYWTLKSAGVENLSILNGGMVAWMADAGREVSTEPVTVAASEIEVTFSDEWLATREDVLAVVEGEDDARLVDARPQAFWEGEESHPAAARAGTLPQSEYFTHSRWFASGPAIVDAEAARALATENGFEAGDELISFCNTGHWAATNWFALNELAGVEDVKLYPESLVGWSNADLPMDNTPGLIENLFDTITGDR